MMRWCALVAILFALSGCSEAAPTASDIEDGYRNLAAKNLAKAVADFGSEDQVPPILLGMIKTTGRVDSPHCEKTQNDLGFICLYNFTPVNGAGVVLEMIPDIKAHVWQADVGWMVHEVPG